MSKVRNQIEYLLYADNALFTDPTTKIGGEKMTYQIPTISALIGITESIYWKPSINWVIDEVKIVNKISMKMKAIRPIEYGGGNTLAQYTYLDDVCYAVRAHFEFNENRPDLKSDFNEHKHHQIALRCVKKGGRRDIFLGTRECQGYVEPCQFDEVTSYYEGIDLDFSTMLHSLSYPSQSGRHQLEALLWEPQMKNGVISCIPQSACTKRKHVADYALKEFIIGQNMESVEDTFTKLGGD